MQDVTGISHLNSPIKIYIRIKNLDKISIEDDNVAVSGPLFLDSFGSSKLTINHARIGKLPGGNDDQGTSMNQDQLFPLESAAEQIKNIV